MASGRVPTTTRILCIASINEWLVSDHIVTVTPVHMLWTAHTRNRIFGLR